MADAMVTGGEKKTSYDEVPYESHAFPQSHPDRLAALGRLFGMDPVPVEKCRVLELGCASGGNLIPMAYQLPGSEFVGVDNSRREVDMGQEVISDMALTNVRIDHASILDVDASWGMFDYIICHGVYAWVPDHVQEKILSVAAENLRPQGVAYVSYNTYPGWHMREMIRHMMLYHTGQFTDATQRIQQARALIDFLARSAPAQENYFGLLLKSELELIKKSRDYYLYHEHLEDENKPLYFHVFAERAEAHGLQYLGEAEFSTMLTSGFPKEVADTLKRISPHIVRTEQYMDFLRNRLFRQTLLCHRDIVLKRNLAPDDVQDFLVASAAAPEKGPADLKSGSMQSFRTPRGTSVQTNRPLTKAALAILREHWPRALAMENLVQETLRRLKEGEIQNVSEGQVERRILQGDLLQCYSANVVEFHTWQADFLRQPSEYPQISKLTAYQTAHRLPLVNRRHEAVNLDVVGLQLVPFLDGTRDRTSLLDCMHKLVETGALTVRQDNKPVSDEGLIKSSLEKALANTLVNMAAAALLVDGG